MREPAVPEGEKSWFCLFYADFCFGDDGSDPCTTYAKAMALAQKKPQESTVAYQYWVGHRALLRKPAGRGAIWTNEHTGTGKQADHPGHLFVWGTSLGATLGGRTLFCMKDVAITGGDAQVDDKVLTYEQAFAKVKAHGKTESAYVWDPKTKQLAEKPASTRSGKWSEAKGSTLFMWADEVINDERIDALSPKVDLALLKHETFPNGREGQHTWT